MAVTTTTVSTGPLTADGVTPLPFTFQAASADEIEVTLDGEVVDPSAYTVTLNADDTGSVTPTSAWAGEVYISSKPDFGQEANWERYAPYFPDQLVPPLDKLAKQNLYLKDEVERAIVVPREGGVEGLFPYIDINGNVSWSSGTGADAGLRSDLAASTGPALIGYADSSLEDKLLPFAVLSDWASLANTAAQFEQAMRELHAEGGGSLFIPRGNYEEVGNLLVPYGISNISVYAYGAVFRNARLAIQGGYGLGDARYINFFGGTVTDDTGVEYDGEGNPTSTKWLLDVSGKDILIRDTKFRCINNDNEIVPKPNYIGFFRVDAANALRAERVTLDGVGFDGSNGVLVAGRGHRIRNNDWTNASAYTDAFGGDDAIAIKAIGESTYDIKIEDSTFNGYAAMASLGSEIGTNGADDPDFSIGVTDIHLNRNTGNNVAAVFYLKPGAVGDAGVAYDYRNGLIDRIYGRGNHLEDLTGKRMLTPIQINMGRGSKLGKISIKDTFIRGRMSHGVDDAGVASASAANNALCQIIVRDMSTFGTDAGSIIEHVEIDGLTHEDPFDGQRKSSADASRPGYAARFLVYIETEHAAGSIGRIDVKNLVSNGVTSCAMYVGADVDGPVTLDGYDLTNVCTAPVSADFAAGVVSAAANVYMTNPVRLEMAGAELPVKMVGVGRIHGEAKEAWIGDIPGATASISVHPHTALGDEYITSFELVNGADIGLSTGSYASLFLYRRSDSGQIVVANTLEGDSGSVGDFTAGVPNPLSNTPFATVNAILEAGDGLRLDITNTTGGTDFTRLRAIVRTVPLGRKQ